MDHVGSTIKQIQGLFCRSELFKTGLKKCLTIVLFFRKTTSEKFPKFPYKTEISHTKSEKMSLTEMRLKTSRINRKWFLRPDSESLERVDLHSIFE